MTKLKLRSANAVITTGTGMPGSIFWVTALNSLTNAMMFRPRWPSAGPTGGGGRRRIRGRLFRLVRGAGYAIENGISTVPRLSLPGRAKRRIIAKGGHHEALHASGLDHEPCRRAVRGRQQPAGRVP